MQHLLFTCIAGQPFKLMIFPFASRQNILLKQ